MSKASKRMIDGLTRLRDTLRDGENVAATHKTRTRAELCDRCAKEWQVVTACDGCGRNYCDECWEYHVFERDREIER